MDQMMLREAVECQAPRICCGSPALDNKDSLIRIAEKLEKTPASYIEHWKYEDEYHSLLVSLSGCAGLLRSFNDEISTIVMLTKID